VAFSFGDGLFGGLISDSKSGMPFSFALKTGRLVRVDLDRSAVISGICSVFMQPIFLLGAAYGEYEWHHPRIKVLRHFVSDGQIPGTCCSCDWVLGSKRTFDASEAPFLIEDSDAFRSQLRDPVITEWKPFAG
jgi:hypothetical protein